MRSPSRGPLCCSRPRLGGRAAPPQAPPGGAIHFRYVAADFRILFVADVVGQPGREAVKAVLPGLKRELEPDVTILNGENAAGGFGLTHKTVEKQRGAGASEVATGNHVFTT